MSVPIKHALRPGECATAEQSAALRAVVDAAGGRLPAAWPITDLIAVNPFAGVQELGFERAVVWGRELLGMRGHLTLDQFRQAYRAGRIEDADLLAALRRRLPQLEAMPMAERVLRADLLHGVEGAPPRRARLGVGAWCDALLGSAVAPAVDDEVLKWSGAFCGSSQAGWKMPGCELGFFSAWRRMASSDPGLARLAPAGAARLIPEEPLATIGWALDLLCVPGSRVERELTEQLFRTPGFAAHFRWRGEYPELAGHPGDIGDLLAVRLSYEALAVWRASAERELSPRALAGMIERERDLEHASTQARPSAQPEHAALAGRVERVALALADEPACPDRAQIAEALTLLGEDQRAWVWLDAYEWHYRDSLLVKLARGSHAAGGGWHPGEGAPEAQAIFCIDTRSEGLRRALESLRPGGWETFGMAGFFGLPVVLRHLRSERTTRLLPGPLSPTAVIGELDAPGAAEALSGRLRSQALALAHRSAKSSPLAPYSMAEASGWFAAVLAALRTNAPQLPYRSPKPRPELALQDGLPLAEQIDWAEQTLRTIGLVERFAPTILIVGHTSIVENNAYRAALECGACGGHGGGDNARLAAAILNDSRVRAALRARGLDVPDGSRFVPAEHDTATDRVSLLGGGAQPSGRVRADLEAAGAVLAEQRARSLPDRWHPRRRARDWAQVRPEWGLVRNAAFIIAPSETVSGLDLECRTFLHSYDWRQDPDGSALLTILTAPGLVVQWINAQYYFSSVDPDVLGAGDKTLHSVIGDVGVLQGAGGDLLLGLPWQSVAHGRELFHEPMRVLFVVQAPLERIDALVAGNELLQQYIGGGWIALAAREDFDRPWRLRQQTGGWKRWRPAHPGPAG